jgi:hypothetical protein
MRSFRSVVGALLLGGALTATLSGCVIRAQARIRPAVVVVDDAPPEPRDENPGTRSGYVWIRGYWEKSGGQWEWRSGHWERSRANYVWVEGRWEHRGRQWHWIDGRWQRDHGGGPVVRDHRTPPPEPERRNETVRVRDHRSQPEPEVNVRDHRSAPRDYPTEPPPAPRAENPGNKAKHVWIAGYYRWDNGAYNWIPGHWERKKAGKNWVDGRWERRGDRYWWVEGGWR